MFRIFFISFLFLGCSKKKEVEYVHAKPTDQQLLIENLDIQIISAVPGKINLDDDLVIDDVLPVAKAESSKSTAEASVNLSVQCGDGADKQESKKVKLKKGKYKLFQLVPLKFLTQKFNEAVRNFTCSFSFTYKKKKTKDLVPIAFQNDDYRGNLALTKGLEVFPKSDGGILQPEQVDEIKIDDIGEAADVTLVCDEFTVKSQNQVLNRFRLSKFLREGMNSGVTRSVQSCRVIAENPSVPTQIFVSHRFTVLLAYPDIRVQFQNLLQNFEKFQTVGVMGIVVKNNGDFPIEVDIDSLPQQITWSPVYGYRSPRTAGVVELNKTYSRKLNWLIAQKSVEPSIRNLNLGANEEVALIAKTQLNVNCVEGITRLQMQPSAQFLGQMISLDSYGVILKVKYLGDFLQDINISFESHYPPSFFGQTRWVSFNGLQYNGRETWPRAHIVRGGDEVCTP